MQNPSNNSSWKYALTFILLILVVVVSRLYAYSLPSLERLGMEVAVQSAAEQVYANSGRSTNSGIDPLVNQALYQQPHLWKEEAARLSTEFKQQKQYIGEDGVSRPFIAGYDSYHWLRLARNFLTHGSICDNPEQPLCRNDLSLAPVGHDQELIASPHILSIAWFHQFLSFFNEAIQLAGSATVLSIFLSVLVLFPAFLIGHSLCGFYGAISTSFLISFGSIYISRTLGVDTDIWNVLLLLCILSCGIQALPVTSRRGALIWIALAGLFTGFWALIWSGWALGYLIILTGLLVHLSICLMTSTSRESIFTAALMLVVYYLSSGLIPAMSEVETGYFTFPVSFINSFMVDDSPALSVLNWPDNFQTVAEWVKVGVAGVLFLHGGVFQFLLACLGGLLLMTGKPFDANKRMIVGVVVAFYGLLFFYRPESKWIFFAVISLPIVLIGLYRLQETKGKQDNALSICSLVLISFLACLWLSVDALRLLLFSWIPVAILLSVTIVRLSESLYAWLRPALKPVAAFSISAVLFSGMTVFAALPGLTTLESYRPSMSRALHQSLTDIRDQTPEDAIISTMWEYGYFAQYYAQRRTTADGGTLRNHAHYWLNRVFTESDERRAVGILRMLNCGSDASALEEKQYSAGERLIKTGRSEAAAYRILESLLILDKTAAIEKLEVAGLKPDQIQTVLSATHCEVSESLLITTTEMISKSPAWFGSGLTDLFGSKQEQVNALKYRMSTSWLGCNSRAEDIPDLACEVSLMSESGLKPYLFVVEFAKPEEFSLLTETNNRIKPALLIIADEDGVMRYKTDQPDFENLAVLLDRTRNQILTGRPEVLDSVYAKLMLLEGKQSEFFEKVSAHKDERGESVMVWRVNNWGSGSRN